MTNQGIPHLEAPAPATITEDFVRTRKGLPDEEYLRIIGDAVLAIQKLDERAREVQLTRLPTVPVWSSTDAGSINTVNQSWNVPQTFRVKYYIVFADKPCWFVLKNGPRSDGPYRVVDGYTRLDLEDILLGGNSLSIESIAAASANVRLYAVGVYVKA